MRIANVAVPLGVALLAGALLGVAACGSPGTVTVGLASPSASHSATAAPRSAAGAPGADPNVSQPWAVVSAYYGDIESGDYAGAWALLDSGMTTGQTYQQFVDGFTCTGGQALSEHWQSGDQRNFALAATDSATGAVQDFPGTDTDRGGLIEASDVSLDYLLASSFCRASPCS